MLKHTAFPGFALISLMLVNAAVCASPYPEKGHYIEVPPGTKLCDPGEDVYGFYLVKSSINPNGTQAVEYYRFSSSSDPETETPLPKLQRSVIVRFRKHPQYKDKVEVIDALTGQADEFPYAVCKK